MDIRELTETYAVAPQIAPEDVATLKAAGFVAVVCNRPDDEVGPDIASAAMRDAVVAAGLAWIDNPVSPAGMTAENVAAQRAAVDAAGAGKVFAYCRSGTRSAIVWAFSEAGRRPVEEIVAAAARGGYDLMPYRDQIAAMAARG